MEKTSQELRVRVINEAALDVIQDAARDLLRMTAVAEAAAEDTAAAEARAEAAEKERDAAEARTEEALKDKDAAVARAEAAERRHAAIADAYCSSVRCWKCAPNITPALAQPFDTFPGESLGAGGSISPEQRRVALIEHARMEYDKVIAESKKTAADEERNRRADAADAADLEKDPKGKGPMTTCM